MAYGEARRPVGGKVPQDEAIESGGEEEIEDTDKATDVTHARGVIDFTPGEGNFAVAVAERKGSVLYFGLCHTELHCQLLRDRLTDCVLEGMQKENSPLFNELCAAAMKLGTIVKKKIDEPKKDPPKIKNKNKRKSPDEKRKKQKYKKKKSSESSSPASPSSENSQEE